MSQLHRTMTGQSQQSHISEQTIPANSPTLSRTTTADPLTGTINHLTPVQEEKLQEFKRQLEKGGWWTPNGVNGKPSHDDGTLVRYLRARKFDISGAIGQFTDHEKWLKEERVEELYDHFDVEAYERARLMYPQWTGHRDKRGIPIYVYVIKGLDSKSVSKYQKETQAYKDSLPYHKNLQTPAKLLPLFALYQNLLTFVLPLVSSLDRPNPEVPVTNSTNIVDIQGVGLTQFWNLKQHMQDASVLATAHYPETLDRIFIIGAPSFFPTVWGWIKRWFDPVTVSKIFILSKHDVKPTLSKYMELRDIPKRYGGELEWEWGNLPHLDAETRAAVEKDGNKGWVKGPCLWLSGRRVVVGSEKGKIRTPDAEVQKLQPVVYAADYTAIPVHPEKTMSKSQANHNEAPQTQHHHSHHNHHSHHHHQSQQANGTAEPHHRAEEAALAAGGGATAATIIQKETSHPIDQPPAVTERETSQPSAQPHAHPLTGGSLYASVTSSAPAPAPSAAPAPSESYIAPTPTTQAPPQVYDHAPAQPQPGPVPAHAVLMTKAIVEKLQGESVSVIPASANGHAGGHPEVTVASDPSKGLAIETERLALADAGAGVSIAQRPHIERFVTAAEI
ncbi:CRAL-TRIO domain-containing protein [Exophiala viscosa]|uniref:CRAL-TRIO domain-containing protein n=1 Tax=Exophiala viscosa TaxID=2486360 RepID=UPI00219C7138|nr:CRAL-TRIO domain-containing protein [Exophiala viscosa]